MSRDVDKLMIGEHFSSDCLNLNLIIRHRFKDPIDQSEWKAEKTFNQWQGYKKYVTCDKRGKTHDAWYTRENTSVAGIFARQNI